MRGYLLRRGCALLRRMRLGHDGRASPRFRIALQPLEVGAQIGGMLVTQIAILLQRLVDDVFELRRNIGVETHRRDRSALQNRVKDRSRRIPTKRHRPGCHLVEHASKGK